MRRIIGVILAVLGVLLIVAAVLLPTWVVGQLMKFPLDEHQNATLEAANASYFSQKVLKERTGVTIQATYTITGDPSKGNSSTAVWSQASSVTDVTNHELIQQMTRTFAFNRRTGQLVNCCGESINGKPVRQTGYSGSVFPFGTKKQTYDVFDTTLLRPVPFVYSGTTSVNGIQVYEFTENIAPTTVATLKIPGALIGQKAALLTMSEVDQIHLVDYVDPVTGALLNVNEHQTVTLRDPASGATAALLYDADLIATPATVAHTTALDSGGRDELALVETILPIVFGIVGAVALAGGIFLARPRRRPSATGEADAAVPEMASSAVEAPEGEGLEA
jgi:hypothetical protein